MKLIQQTKFGECGAACLAMVLDLTLDQVLMILKEDFRLDPSVDGLIDREMVAVLKHLGISTARRAHDRPDYRPAILTVPSLNHRGFLHYIVWDGEQYFDPTSGYLTYPEDAPLYKGEKLISWATAIIWGDYDGPTF